MVPSGSITNSIDEVYGRAGARHRCQGALPLSQSPASRPLDVAWCETTCSTRKAFVSTTTTYHRVGVACCACRDDVCGSRYYRLFPQANMPISRGEPITIPRFTRGTQFIIFLRRTDYHPCRKRQYEDDSHSSTDVEIRIEVHGISTSSPSFDATKQRMAAMRGVGPPTWRSSM